MKWNSNLYDKKHDFVAEYGKGLLEFVPENPNQKILDLGCGTGTLTTQLTNFAGTVVGVDSSDDMIEKARSRYNNIEFIVCDALDLPFENEFDVVFSNAVFHWIENHDLLLKNIHRALKDNGILICEFGADGNIATIEKAFEKCSEELGFKYKAKFNFPTPETFEKTLKDNDFRIDRVYAYDRPTVLKDEEQGLANWMKQFFASELEQMPKEAQEQILKMVEDATREKLWNGKEWVADYRRLRAIAYKK